MSFARCVKESSESSTSGAQHQKLDQFLMGDKLIKAISVPHNKKRSLTLKLGCHSWKQVEWPYEGTQLLGDTYINNFIVWTGRWCVRDDKYWSKRTHALLIPLSVPYTFILHVFGIFPFNWANQYLRFFRRRRVKSQLNRLQQTLRTAENRDATCHR